MDWFWHAMWIAFVVIPVAFLWAFCFVDIFVRRDLSGWGRCGWLLAVLILPFIGSLCYVAVRPKSEAVGTASRPVNRTAISDDSVADEISKLDRLRTSGVLTDQEFADQKARILDLPAQRGTGRSTRTGSRT